ncbi:hypothetical protein HNR19_004256 [Nocardioides thalensis]|uniref:Uncharacterized protein n=1 Tax=Nocardioides thalensis TaxID=1914755 RepID=A0A853CAV9_9ACTN|nr:hypothetical protein [Nocardioides thalensis]NYJ03558.1 hypothetical protein [Nocardioides thalensis]
MKPLYAIALAVAVILLETPTLRFDLYANPLGWLLLLLALRTLRDDPPYRFNAALWTLGLLALVTDSVLWFPGPSEWLDDAEPALAWAAGLPRFGCFALLCHRLGSAAVEDSRVAAGLFQWTAVAMAAVMVGPVLVYGGGIDEVEDVVGTLVPLAQLALIVLSLVFAGREWAAARETPPGDQPSLPTTT